MIRGVNLLFFIYLKLFKFDCECFGIEGKKLIVDIIRDFDFWI